MPQEPPRRPSDSPRAPSAQLDPDDRDGDRPTVNPPFDVEAFARATALAGPGAPSARAHEPPEVREEQITLTNEVELEHARAQSTLASIPPKRANTPTMLSLANSRFASALRPALGAQAPASEDRGEPQTLSSSSIEAAVLGAIKSSAGPEITEHTMDDPVAEMRARFSLGDYSGALEVAELLLAEDETDADVLSCAQECRTILEAMCMARLGSLHQIPTVIVQRAQLRWLSMDHRAGFVLSLIDGVSTIENVLDVSGMPRLDAMRVLLEFVDQEIVALR
ncbi:MAG: hypothetical protein ACREJ3_13675 [Polyangiaceae bacterium]